MKYTEKLGLKKPDLTDYVNISDLNDNMDVLDEEVGDLKEGSTVIEELETTNKSLVGAINEIDGEVKSHKADDATLKHKAKQIELEDAEGNFVASNIEGSMQELFTNVSNGKSLVGGAITDIDSNVAIPTDPTFQDLAGAIGQISTGKKWATGVSMETSALSAEKGVIPHSYKTINFNLDFVPSIVLINFSRLTTTNTRPGYESTARIEGGWVSNLSTLSLATPLTSYKVSVDVKDISNTQAVIEMRSGNYTYTFSTMEFSSTDGIRWYTFE